MEAAQAHLIIEGRVQGVFFRAFTNEIAAQLGLNGWVKNLYDGRVEAVFEGHKKLVDQAIDQCRKGPPGSYVTDVQVSWESPSGAYRGFEIKY